MHLKAMGTLELGIPCKVAKASGLQGGKNEFMVVSASFQPPPLSTNPLKHKAQTSSFQLSIYRGHHCAGRWEGARGQEGRTGRAMESAEEWKHVNR